MRTLAAALFVSVVAAGCGHMGYHHGEYYGVGHRAPPAPTRQDCSAATCPIDVDVVASMRNGEMRLSIKTVDELHVLKENHGTDGKGIQIVWHLKNPDYRFEDDSVEFYEGQATSQFSGNGIGREGAEYRWVDRNTDSHRYGYQLKVYNRKTGDWIPLDPWIWNGR